MSRDNIVCRIEHHAVLFALLAKYAVTICGKRGEEAIQKGMIVYGNERGARMAANALARGDELTTMTSQAYGEWKPDYEGQMEFGQEVDIISDGVAYRSILTGRERGKNTKLVFGTVRLDLTKILRRSGNG